jgi:hypothetical protein
MISKTNCRAWTESIGGRTPDRSSVEALKFRDSKLVRPAGLCLQVGCWIMEMKGEGEGEIEKVMRWTGSLARQILG